jgi:DNA segregation ATPase FtsK/SpoIIIE, S-DNA-T family
MTTIQSTMNGILNDFGIEGTCIRAEVNRHLAFYDIRPARIPSALKKLKGNADGIAIALQSQTVPIMRLVPEQGIIRLQCALSEAEPIELMKLFYESDFIPNSFVFPMLLGEDDAGKKLWIDFNHNPHLLVAGSTSSGKSTLLHTLIANGLFLHALRLRNVWLFLNDPKRIEFQEYQNSSELDGILEVASTYSETVDQLEYLCDMMESRYKTMGELGMRSIEDNRFKIPLALCIIDEVADLMIQDKKGGRLQSLIVKIAQKGRAAGIFLTLATQRPSVDVITGTIKANFPGRIACRTATRKDSEVILDRPGAESLLGRGDAVLQNMKHASVRFQVAYTTPQKTIEHFNHMKTINITEV